VAVARRLQRASRHLGTVDPLPVVKPLLDRTFALPAGDRRYAVNALTPGAVPFEPSFSELQPGLLRFTVEPLGPGASTIERRDEATREMRRLVNNLISREALRWFDQRSEPWRSTGSGARLNYGAFFGSTYDRDGLHSAKVYYELQPHHIEGLPLKLLELVSLALQIMPNLHPLFTTIACQRHTGGQRLTFLQRGPLRLADLQPLLETLGLGHQLPGIMQVIGLALGGRFDLPANASMLAFGFTEDGPEFELYVLMGMIPDVPPNFLDLLTLGMSERPRELQAMINWLRAFTPESADWPGNFSILSVRTTRADAPRVSLYLRPAEFDLAVNAARDNGDGRGSGERDGDSDRDDDVIDDRDVADAA
jgi:hypothetical protein